MKNFGLTLLFLCLLFLHSHSQHTTQGESNGQNSDVASNTNNIENNNLGETPSNTDNIENNNTPEEAMGEEESSTRYSYRDPEFWIFAAISTFLVLFAGLCSGLTVGYLSIDPLGLEIKMKIGTDQEKASAAKIIPILAKHHLLLGTLLVSNAFAMEALPVFLHNIVPAFVAILISTIFVVIFGEILPQAYCTGPAQIQIAEKMSGTVNCLMKMLWIICYPLALFLDWLLGTHSAKRFEKKDLKAIIELHEIKKKEKNERGHDGHDDPHHEDGGVLTGEETVMINSIIDLREDNVTKVMIPIEKVFMLSAREKINEDLLKRIKIKGYSKIPIYEQNKNNVIGTIKSKSLIESLENNPNKQISSFYSLIPPLIVSKDTSLFEMLMIFQDKGQTISLINDEVKKIKNEGHKAHEEQFFSKRDLIVDSTSNKYNLIGLISIKDIFEVMIQKELADDDVHQTLTGNYMLANKPKKPNLDDPKIENKDLLYPLIKE